MRLVKLTSFAARVAFERRYRAQLADRAYEAEVASDRVSVYDENGRLIAALLPCPCGVWAERVRACAGCGVRICDQCRARGYIEYWCRPCGSQAAQRRMR